mgnify:CR=1 FL=1
MDGRSERTARIGTAGLVAAVIAHLVWDPAVTLLRIHPAAWLATKLVVVGGFAAVVVRIGAHRNPVTVWLLWLVALLGVVAPLGWLELLVAGGG